MKFKKGDHIKIIAGKFKNKDGKIKKTSNKNNKVIVEGVNILKKHVKPSQSTPDGGIKEIEGWIHASNIALIVGKGKNAKMSKIGYRFEKDKKIRIARKNNQKI